LTGLEVEKKSFRKCGAFIAGIKEGICRNQNHHSEKSQKLSSARQNKKCQQFASISAQETRVARCHIFKPKIPI
jgi:hypothetical protein